MRRLNASNIFCVVSFIPYTQVWLDVVTLFAQCGTLRRSILVSKQNSDDIIQFSFFQNILNRERPSSGDDFRYRFEPGLPPELLGKSIQSSGSTS